MKNKLFLSICLFGLTAAIPQAEAGFEWRGMPAPYHQADAQDLPAPIGAQAGISNVPAAPVAPVELVTTIENASMPPMAAPAVSVPESRHTDIGLPGAYYGFGTDIPLDMAVRQIIPSDLSAEFDDAIDLRRRVSWKGDGYWSSTLETVLNGQGLAFDVVGGSVKIEPQRDMMYEMPAPEPRPVLTLPAPAPAPVPVYGDSAVPDPGAAAVMTQAAQWTAAPQDTLRQTLEKWTAAAGIRLYWATDYDYRLKKPVHLDGSFEQAAGVLLESFRKVEPRPYGKLMRNEGGGRALVIRTYGEK